jgi:hypothetical protein
MKYGREVLGNGAVVRKICCVDLSYQIYEVFFLFALIYSEAFGNRYKVECPFPCVTDDTLRSDRHGEPYTRVADS